MSHAHYVSVLGMCYCSHNGTYIGKFFLPPVKSSFVEIRGFERIATMCYVDKLTYFTVLSLTHY